MMVIHEKVVRRWNETCPPGTPVRYYPALTEDETVDTVTTSESWLMDPWTPVVKINAVENPVSTNNLVVLNG